MYTLYFIIMKHTYYMLRYVVMCLGNLSKTEDFKKRINNEAIQCHLDLRYHTILY